uniref:Elongation of fatty acids protein n=1 Tax=Rebecca salina TaxID=561169 RepID=E2D8D8_REBSA|nr:delta-9 elongase [Rebecca salina]
MATEGMPAITLDWLLSPGLKDAVIGGEVLYFSLGYLLLEPILKRSPFVDKRKGAYRNGMIAYNILMCGFSLVCFVCQMAALGLDRGHLQFVRDLTGDSVVQLYQDVSPSPAFANKLFRYSAVAFHYSKYVEYMDTAWLVLKGKPVSFLQGFHHFGAAWDTYFGITFQNEGTYVFVLLNAFIHTIMYTYYGATAAGIKISMKPLITLMQITQFLLGFALVYPYIDLGYFRASPELVWSYLFNYAYVLMVLFLFMRFFYHDNFSKHKPISRIDSSNRMKTE